VTDKFSSSSAFVAAAVSSVAAVERGTDLNSLLVGVVNNDMVDDDVVAGLAAPRIIALLLFFLEM
jgi:hypothetical protein